MINKDNFIDKEYDVFKMFNERFALVSAGNIDDFNCMTLGWGMMGNIWGHPGSALTIYVSPNRYTWNYIDKNDYFIVSFFPEEYKKDLAYLGSHSKRDGDKISHTKLTPIDSKYGVTFKEACLTFICKKAYTHQFELDKTPDFMQENLYKKIEPHYSIIGFIEDVYGN